MGLLVLASGSGLAASKNETAALSRVDIQAQWAAELPQVLSPADVATYKRIFALQAARDWPAVERETAKLKDRRLLGHVLAERYLHAPGSYASHHDLAAWLKDYADHPDASAIYQLALKRAPKKGAVPLRRPTVENLKSGWFAEEEEPADQPEDTPDIADAPSPPGPKLVGEMLGRASGVKGQIAQRLRAGDLAGAERLLRTRDTARLLSDGEYDYLKARIAAGWFAQGNDAQALELASEAASRSGPIVPRANWIAGLSLYKQGRFSDASKYFEALARTPNAQPWDLAAGAFWAGRAHLQARRPQVFGYWALQAASYPQTFYGLLAARTMSVVPAIDWDPPPLSRGETDSLVATASGGRAFALIQIGEHRRAEREFSRLQAAGGSGVTRALLGVAMRANMPTLSIRLGRELSEIDGRRHEGALYPIPPWRPANGFEVDPALVYAIMRQESAFNPRALSPAGARGLMQIMPGTAQLLDGRSFKGRTDELYEPPLNIALGQKYLKQLLDNDVVQGDLIRLAAAYNGGPGNLAKWKRKQDMRGDPADDALLFIEGLPFPETRHYITRVLFNYWMYSHRLAHPTPSLELLAAGEWPTYAPRDGEQTPTIEIAVAAVSTPPAAPASAPAPVAVPAPVQTVAVVPSQVVATSQVVAPSQVVVPNQVVPNQTPAEPAPTVVNAETLAPLTTASRSIERASAERPTTPGLALAPASSSMMPAINPAEFQFMLPMPPIARPAFQTVSAEPAASSPSKIKKKKKLANKGPAPLAKN